MSCDETMMLLMILLTSKYLPLIYQIDTLNIVSLRPRPAVKIVNSFMVQLCLHKRAVTRGQGASYPQFISNCTTKVTMSVRSVALAALAPDGTSKEQTNSLGRSRKSVLFDWLSCTLGREWMKMKRRREVAAEDSRAIPHSGLLFSHQRMRCPATTKHQFILSLHFVDISVKPCNLRQGDGPRVSCKAISP